MKQLNSSKNKELADYCHFFRGICFRENGLFKDSESELNLISKNFIFYTLVNKELGAVSLELEQFEKAIHYFKAVEKTPNLEKLGLKINPIYTNLGLCYLHLNQFEKAEEYLFKNKKILEKENNIDGLITFFTNIANLYYEQDKNEQAFLYFEKAYQLSKKVETFDQKQNASKNMAVFEENRNNFKQALFYRKEAEQWIIKEGKDIVNEEEENFGLPIVLTIIYYDNKGNYPIDENPFNIFMISNKMYPTFAFDKKAYKMIVKEHELNYKQGEVNIKKPTHLHYVK